MTLARSRWLRLAWFAATDLTGVSVLDNNGTLPLPTGQFITAPGADD